MRIENITNISKSYTKTVETYLTSFGKVGLSYRREHGRRLGWTVCLTRSSACLGEKQRRWFFQDENAARTLMSRLRDGDASVLEVAYARPSDFREKVAGIFKNPSKRHQGLAHIALLCEIDKERSTSRSPDRLLHRDVLASVLRDRPEIPTSAKAFSEWIAWALVKLRETNLTFPGQPLSITTTQQRVTLLKKCLGGIKRFRHVFPDYHFDLDEIDEVCKEFVTLSRANLKEKTSFEPLGKQEFLELIESSPGIGATLRVIAQTSRGLRPSEIRAINYNEHIQNKRLMLSKLTTKTNTERNPPAPIILRLYLRLNLTLSKEELRWFDKKVFPSTERALRSTCLTHLILNGLDPLTAASYAGHTDIHMITRHYVKVRPVDWTDTVTPETYYGVAPVTVAGKPVTYGETPFENWLLALALEKLHACMPDVEFQGVKNLLLNEYDRDTFAVTVPLKSASF